jgi:hypothetical protein
MPAGFVRRAEGAPIGIVVDPKGDGDSLYNVKERARPGDVPTTSLR